MKHNIIVIAVALMGVISAQAQEQKQEKRASLGINIGHTSDDSLKVSAVNVGLLTITDSLKGVQISPVSNVAEYARFQKKTSSRDNAPTVLTTFLRRVTL